LIPGYSNARRCNDTEHSDSTPCPLVCKQFWAEANSELFATCTSCFQEAGALQSFALSDQASVSCIPRLLIRFPLGRYSTTSWRPVLRASLLGKFQSLEGVHLQIDISRSDYQDALRSNDGTHSVFWTSRQLPPVTHALQQHQVQEALNTVTIRIQKHPSERPVKSNRLQGIEQAIKRQLLNPHERRMSTRGRNENREESYV
jgi:hypothetical protein